MNYYKQFYHLLLSLDLKLENILIDENDIIKIADFGWAVHTKFRRKRNTICGTIQCNFKNIIFIYLIIIFLIDLAPEILNSEGYDENLDIWCLGIITYELLFARSPFEISYEEPRENVLDRIINLEFNFEDSEISISENAKDFIKNVKNLYIIKKILKISKISKNYSKIIQKIIKIMKIKNNS